MRLFAPDLLEESLALSPAVNAAALAAGVALWAAGFRAHRFWVVLTVTTAAGLAGLASGKALGMQALVAGVLLAVAGGLLALELSKVAAFLLGGAAATLGVQAVLPGAQDLSVAFLCGGLLGLTLYPLWLMTLTSFLGAVLTWYGGLGLAAKFLKLDAAALADQRAALLHAAVAAATLAGVALQGWAERRRRAASREDSGKGEDRDADDGKGKRRKGKRQKPGRDGVSGVRKLLSASWLSRR